MLNRIAHIGLNASGKKSKPKYRKREFGEVFSSHHLELKDSLTINPAFRLLNHFGVLIKDLHSQHPGSLQLKVRIDEFIFDIKTDAHKILAESGIEYDVWEDKDDKSTFKILFETKTRFTNEFTTFSELELDSLRFLFNRCYDLGINNEINSGNTLAINNLLDRIYTQMIGEFSKINSNAHCLQHFQGVASLH